MVAQSRGAKFHLALPDPVTNTRTLEPDGEFSRELCNEALDDIRIHMKWPSVEAYLRNMDEVEEAILKERNKK